MLEKIIVYFHYPFVRYALIVGVLIAICSSVFGVTLVLKRFSFIGDGLSHVAFGAIALAAILNVTNNLLIVLPITVICAVLLLRTGQNSKIRGDAMIAMVSVGALAVGYLLLNIFSTSTNIAGDVCSSLFGSTSIITLTKTDVIICSVLCLAVMIIYLLLYNRIFAITFDEAFMKASGFNTEVYNTLLAVIIAVIIVLAMNLVGSLLISALIVFPALSSMRVFNNFKKVVISSVIISVICAVIGIITALIISAPIGPTIVLANVLIFTIFYVFGKIKVKQ